MTTHSVAIRVDADPQAGLGHFRRCLTLAELLGDSGCRVRLVCMNRLDPAIAPLAGSCAVSALEEASRVPAGAAAPDEELWDADATLSVIGKGNNASWVVVDSYRLGHRWERRVRDAGHRIMVIDDFRNRMHHADLLVSDSEGPFDPALNGVASGARTLVGRKYSLIGPEYAYAPTPFPRNPGPRRVLVSYGGGDSTNETRKAIAAIGQLKSGGAARDALGETDVVVGNLNASGREIARCAQSVQDMAVHVAPASLAPLMRAADLILTAGGNTLVEALALRKPALVTITHENQALMVNQLAADRMIRVLGTQDTVGPDDVAAAIAGALADFAAFAAHVASRPLFDHLGAQRIAAVMLQVPEGGGQDDR
jgi:UDP-2,4-diacetamido-2,4,6-trideoxy-beta-L-altropyranose hydrolase